MKRLILLFTLLPLFTIAQQTYVPDNAFEQKLINMGLDNILDDYVTTANISSVTNLSIWNLMISDLTGIEDFTALISLDCSGNQLTSLDISNNDLPKEESDVLPEMSDAYDALLALGFQMKDIRNAISTIQSKDKEMGTEEIVKQALTELR